MIVMAVPVKDLVNAKQRLLPILGPAERAALAQAMLRDVLHALTGAHLDAVWVVTRDPAVIAAARPLGAEIVSEAANAGHTAAVAHAQTQAAGRGARVFATVPGDVPCVTAEEIRALAERRGVAAGGCVRALPLRARHQRGRPLPPDLMPLTFGEPSFENHLATAARHGLVARVLRLPRLGLDIDTPGDLRALLGKGPDTESGRLLAAWSIAERLALGHPLGA